MVTVAIIGGCSLGNTIKGHRVDSKD
jgi:hypothetical protein